MADDHPDERPDNDAMRERSGLGYRAFTDPRNDEYPIGPYLVSAYGAAPTLPAEKVWVTRGKPLDQGSEGMCVAFGWYHELAAEPIRYDVDNDRARAFFSRVQVEDRAMGNRFVTGASVLAGAKAASRAGLLREYRWAKTIDEAITTVLTHGPVVIGTNWYNDMYQTNRAGVMQVTGRYVGGHCFLLAGFYRNHPKHGECFLVQNSWGPSWGLNGLGYLKVSDARKLAKSRTDLCVPTDKWK